MTGPLPTPPTPPPWPGGPRETPPRDLPYSVDGEVIEMCPFCLDAWMTRGHRCAGLVLAMTQAGQAPDLSFDYSRAVA